MKTLFYIDTNNTEQIIYNKSVPQPLKLIDDNMIQQDVKQS